jgi:hypothetical protein
LAENRGVSPQEFDTLQSLADMKMRRVWRCLQPWMMLSAIRWKVKMQRFGMQLFRLAAGARALLGRTTLACATLMSAYSSQAQFFDPNTMLLGLGKTTGTGSAEILAYAPGFGDLMASVMLELKQTEPRFRNCDMVMLEWKRRSDVMAEWNLQHSRFIDPASVTVRNQPPPEPKVLIEGTLHESNGQTSWKITMKVRASGKVLAVSEGVSPNDEIVTLAPDRVARVMMEAACPSGWTVSGGGARIKVSGHVSDVNAPFNVSGVFPGGNAEFVYSPTGVDSGKVVYTLSGGGVSGGGEGNYTIAATENRGYIIKQTTNGCIDGIPNSCKVNSETLTLTPD